MKYNYNIGNKHNSIDDDYVIITIISKINKEYFQI